MNDNLTEIVMVLDRSGSMEAVKSDMIGGINNFVKEQKECEGEANFTLAQFDTEYEILYDGTKIQDVGPLELVPRGCTALLDAIGRTINVTKDRLDKLDEDAKPSKVLFTVVTDGHENSSHEFTKAKILAMITKQKDEQKWEFVFLGANQDAIDEGGQIGIGVNQSLTYAPTGQGVQAAFASLSCNATSYRTSGGFNFTGQDRDKQPK